MAAINPGRSGACEKTCNLDAPSTMPNWCIESIRSACAGNMDNPYCQKFCQITNINCDAEIKRYCDGLGIDVAKENPTCACFLPPAFYENYYADLQKKATIPIASTTYQPACSYPRCSASLLIPFAQKALTKCPDLFQCIIAPQINNQGQITGNITIKPTAQCTSVKPVNADGGGGGDGNPPTKINPGLIIGIILAALVAIGLVIGLIKFLTTKPTQVVKTKSVATKTVAPSVPIGTSKYDSWYSY